MDKSHALPIIYQWQLKWLRQETEKSKILFRIDLDDYTAPMVANNALCLDVCSRYVIDPTTMWIKRQILEKFRLSCNDMLSFILLSFARRDNISGWKWSAGRANNVIVTRCMIYYILIQMLCCIRIRLQTAIFLMLRQHFNRIITLKLVTNIPTKTSVNIIKLD